MSLSDAEKELELIRREKEKRKREVELLQQEEMKRLREIERSKNRKRTYDPDQLVSDERFTESYDEDEDYDDEYEESYEEAEERELRKERREKENHRNEKARIKQAKKDLKKKNKKNHFFRNLILFILIILMVVVGAIWNVTRRFEPISTEVAKRPGAMKGSVVNVLLIGQDARDGESGQRTDSIILLSINTAKNKVAMTSIMRDTYVDIPGYGGDRINAAYVYGGIDLLDQTIEENFGITIDGNAMVDFDGFLEAMTAVGDMKMTLTAEEAEYMNANPGFGSNNDASDEVWDLHEGENTLTPSQLLAYSRIRYVGNSDWDRTERQRKVISGAVSKVKHGHLISGYKMACKAAPSITTDIKTFGLLRIAFGIMTGGDMKSHIIPVEDTYYGDNINGMDVLVPDLDKNREYLQKYMNGED